MHLHLSGSRQRKRRRWKIQWQSLSKRRSLEHDTAVHCGHGWGFRLLRYLDSSFHGVERLVA